MCMFTGPEPVDVTRTRIFARAPSPDRQMLAYQMDVTSRQDMAMILPLPVSPGAGQDALRFLSLEQCPHFFAHLESCFPPRYSASMDLGVPGDDPRARLPVHQVGLFDASFVPRIDDFDRLDPRFRLTDEVWLELPEYWDHGFAVFRLRGSGAAGGAAAQTVHPMAFEFRREPSTSLFFPTVHVHDGVVHPLADFHHVLYAQAPLSGGPLDDLDGHGRFKADRPFPGWQRSERAVGRSTATDTAQGLLDPHQVCFRRQLEGRLPNRDTVVIAERSS